MEVYWLKFEIFLMAQFLIDFICNHLFSGKLCLLKKKWNLCYYNVFLFCAKIYPVIKLNFWNQLLMIKEYPCPLTPEQKKKVGGGRGKTISPDILEAVVFLLDCQCGMLATTFLSCACLSCWELTWPQIVSLFWAFISVIWNWHLR